MGRQDPTRAFFWMVYLFLAVLWATTVFNGATGGSLGLAFFTLLTLAHGVLHGLLPYFHAPRRRAAVYVCVQLGLAGTLVVLAHGTMLMPALFFPVAGETLGLFPELKWRLAGLAAAAVSWTASMYAAGGWAVLRMQVPVALISFVFVAVYVTLFTRQMVERERAEKLLAQLEAAHGQLRAYALRVEELTVSHERQRMARELHDTLAQGLAGLIMQLETVDELLDRGDTAKARSIVSRAGQRARTALADARAVIQALRSPSVPGDPLEAIERRVEQFRADTGINCVLEVGPGEIPLEGGLGQQVVRLVQEGLTNIERHAKAGQAAVRLSADEDGFRLTISDDGVGFDPAAAAARPGHFGLMGLQERVRLIGGTLGIESTPGKGTRLLATFPFKEE
jgi:NarL family two-component system sensor histidine kinase YdfH